MCSLVTISIQVLVVNLHKIVPLLFYKSVKERLAEAADFLEERVSLGPCLASTQVAKGDPHRVPYVPVLRNAPQASVSVQDGNI